MEKSAAFFGEGSLDESRTGALSTFMDDPLVPLEYLDATRRKTFYEPEKKLMFALLNDAVYCFQHYFGARKRSGKKLFAAAEQWIFAPEAEGLFSFESVCEHLGIAPNYLRRGLSHWKERKLRSADNQRELSGAHTSEVSPRLLPL